MKIYEEIYNTMIGLYDSAHSMESVENAFAPGSECALAYEKMRDAYERLCHRLGIEKGEDADLEIMVASMETIQKELCRRMFHYGLQIGTKE